MGAQRSIHVGGAKIDLNLDFSKKLCAALLLPPQYRASGGPFSQVEGRACLQHPNVFGGGEKLDAAWEKGMCHSNVLVAFTRPRPKCLSQQSFVIQHTLIPEIAVHGEPKDGFTHTASGGVNLSRFSAGIDMSKPVNWSEPANFERSEPAAFEWRTTTSVKFEHVRPVSDDGFPITTDNEGFSITRVGNSHDNMVVLKQESQYTTLDDIGFFKLNLQVEQGIPVFLKWLIFNRFKFNASRGIKLGRSLWLTSVTGGSIVGDMAPYQAFSIGGPDSVRGYGDGAVGSGRSCLVVNSELTMPLLKGVEGVAFVDFGSDLGTAHLVPGNPALRRGKPGKGIGYGYGLRFISPKVQLRLELAMNALHRKTIYFGIANIAS